MKRRRAGELRAVNVLLRDQRERSTGHRTKVRQWRIYEPEEHKV